MRTAQRAHELLQAQVEDQIAFQRGAQLGREPVEQLQPLAALVQLAGAPLALLKQARILQRDGGLRGKRGGGLDVFRRVKTGVSFFQRDHADQFGFCQQRDAQPAQPLRFNQAGKALIQAHVCHRKRLFGADHLLEQAAIFHQNRQPRAGFAVFKTGCGRHSQLIAVAQPERSRGVRHHRTQLVEQRGDQIVGLQAGGDGSRHLGERLHLRSAPLGRLEKARIFQRQHGLLRQRLRQGLIFHAEGFRRNIVFHHQHAQRAPAKLQWHRQVGHRQAAAGGVAVMQQIFRLQRIFARELHIANALQPALQNHLHRQSRRGCGQVEPRGQQFVHLRVAPRGARNQLVFLLRHHPHPAGLRGGQHLHGGFHQHLQYAVRIEATAELLGIIEQQIHFAQALAGLVQAVQILQRSANLPHQLRKDLPVFVAKRRLLAQPDAQQYGAAVARNFKRQRDKTARVQG